MDVYSIHLPISQKENSEETAYSLTLNNNEFDFVYPFISADSKIELIRSKSSTDIKHLENDTTIIINLQRINDIRRINKYFESVNEKLRNGGILIGCVETYDERRARILEKYPGWIGEIIYDAGFLFNRVLPKLNLTKKVYFLFTKGYDRVISRAETLGRLVSCGFEILGCREINNLLYFCVKKVKKPCCDKHPSYGLFIRMKRCGKGGKLIIVYKLRTMHPFAEYLQEYIYKCNNVDKGGKFKNDFRIARWGYVLRKFWLDELPMLINFFTGDLKLVGVRPLSFQYLSLYPDYFRKRRKKYKPGLVPPYYVDLPKNIDEIVASEERYLNSFDKHPLLTDIKYLLYVFYYIIFKKVRSR